jgi:ABC-type multidrug transport system permease subunit
LIAVDTPEHLKQTYAGLVVELETAQPRIVVDDIRQLTGVSAVTQEGTRMQITTQAGSLVVPQIINLVTRQGELRQIAVREPTLDEVFLRLTGTSFYTQAYPSIVTITPQEIDAYPQDLGYIPYLAVPILVIGLMVGGMVQAGTATAVEWERETVKELLLSPASRVAIVLGKLLAAFLVGLAGAAIVLTVLIALFGIWPVHWGELIGFTLLILALFTAWGTLLGAWLKRRTPLATLAIGLCVPLFFLSGPFGPISFFAPLEQLIARVFPVYYAIVVLQHAFHDFTLNTSGIGTNLLILAAYALGGLVLAVIVLRRTTLAH